MYRAIHDLGEAVSQAAATCVAHPLRTALGALSIATAVATLTLVQTAIDGLGVYARRSVARVFGSETFVMAQIASPGQNQTAHQVSMANFSRRNRSSSRRSLYSDSCLSGSHGGTW